MRVVFLAAAVALAAAAPQAQAASPPVLVSFHQLGGFAGIERGLVVYRSGKVVSDGLPLRTGKLRPVRVRQLRAALVAARFSTLEPEYESDAPIADGYVYRITYAGRTVRIDQGAQLPARLRRVYSLLSGLTRT